MTGTPEPTIASMTSSWPATPSSLTAWAPARMSAATASSAAGTPLRNERNGRSPMMKRVGAPRRTAAGCRAIISTVAASVSAWPCTTIAALSPTRMQSMADVSSTRARLES